MPLSADDSATPRQGWIALACVFLCFALFIHFWEGMRPANETIRIYFTHALVDHQSASIDPVLNELYPNYKESPAYQQKKWHPNIDASQFDGRDYMDKAPGLSLLVAPLYGLLSSLDFDGLRGDWVLVSHLLLLFGVAFPAVLGLLAVRQSIILLGGTPAAAWLGALTFGLATPYALYATLFFGHTLAAAFAALSLLFAIQKRPGWAGAMAGAMVLVDTPTALLAVALGLGAGHVSRRFSDVIRFALAGAPFVIIQLGYNTWLFGDPLTFAYAHKVNAEFAGIIDQGVYGFGLPTMEALIGLTTGSERGLFFHSPVLLLGIVGIWRMRGSDEARPWVSVFTASFIGYLLWITSFADWRAGDSYGPRHLIPLVPFLCIGLGIMLSGTVSKHRRQLLAWAFPGLLVYSLLATWAPAMTFPYAPAAFASPLFELSIPMLISGQVTESLLSAFGASHGWSIAVLSILVASAFALVAGPDSTLKTASSALGRGILVGFLVLGLVVSTLPSPTEAAERERVNIACLLDDCDIARDLCRESNGFLQQQGSQCRCLWPQKQSRPQRHQPGS